MLPYQYPALPLPEAGKHVRLLRLSPGDFSDDLHVELKQVLLDGTSNYEALSYVWGSQAHPISILVGPSREHTISVTQNLATALRYLRDANNFRILWVDAICIDQSNLQERSFQVNLMSDIYRGASRVTVWLGPEENDSSQAFDIMRAIGSSIDVDWIRCTFKPKMAGDDPRPMMEELQHHGFRNEDAHALNRLLHRHWFERLWIRQEIGLATQAIICCGRLSMPWPLFRDAIYFIYTQGWKLMPEALGDQIASFASRITLVYGLCERRVYFLDWLRKDLAHVVCADPRDRIYAILSLLPPSQQNIAIVPDYTRDVALVYQDTTIRFINHTSDLSILLQCEPQDTPPHMPTWVPDWSTELRTEPGIEGSSNASASFESIAASKGEGMLSVAGVAIATIEDVQSMHFGESEDDFQTVLTALWKATMAKLTPSNEIETSQLSAVCDTLCAGSFRHAMIPIREDLPHFKSVMQTFKAVMVTGALLSGDVDSTNEWRKYGDRVRPVCRNRNFFVTTEGSVGIGPPAARPGDIVCVLLGCYSTILLRQTNDNNYQVVGQSYVSGVHAGEALLGPLPEYLRPVRHYNEDVKTFISAYWNEHTKEVQYKDPRLDELLLKPGFQAHDRGKNSLPTIETSVEALRNAGIPAQYLDLV